MAEGAQDGGAFARRDEEVGPVPRREEDLVDLGGPGQVAAVHPQQLEPLTRQGQAEVPRGARVDDAPPLPLAGPRREDGREQAVDQQQVALAAQHPFDRPHVAHLSGGGQRRVAEHDDALAGDRDLVALHEDRPVQAAEDLVRDVSVVVRVVPERPGRVVLGDLDAVVERPPRADGDERVVAAAPGGDGEAVGVEVRRRPEPVDDPHLEQVTGADAPRRPRHGAVVREQARPSPGDLDLGPRGDKLGAEHPAARPQDLGLHPHGSGPRARRDRCATGDRPRQTGPGESPAADDDAECPQPAQLERPSSAERTGHRPSRRTRSRSAYSAASISPRA